MAKVQTKSEFEAAVKANDWKISKNWKEGMEGGVEYCYVKLTARFPYDSVQTVKQQSAAISKIRSAIGSSRFDVSSYEFTNDDGGDLMDAYLWIYVTYTAN